MPLPLRIILGVVFFVALLIKILIRKILLGIVLAFQSIRTSRSISIAVIAVLAVALTGVSILYINTLTSQPVSAAQGRLMQSAGLPVLAPSVESYVRGQMNADAALMWNAMDDDLKRGLIERGGNVQTLQMQLEQAKQAGRVYRDAQYVYGRPLNDGTSIYVFIMKLQIGNEERELPYLFTVGSNGKIIGID